MLLFKNVAEYLKGIFSFGEAVPPAPIILRQQHQPLSSSQKKPPRRRVTQYSVACQVDDSLEDTSDHAVQEVPSVISEPPSEPVSRRSIKSSPLKEPLKTVTKQEKPVDVALSMRQLISLIDETQKLLPEMNNLLVSIEKSSQQSSSLSLSAPKQPSNDNQSIQFDEQQTFQAILDSFIIVKYRYQIPHPLLNLEDYLEIIKIWQSPQYKAEQLAVQHSRLSQRLTNRSMQTLAARRWLNDQIINAYIRLINEEHRQSNLRIVNSFYVNQVLTKDSRSLERLISKADVSAHNVVLFPINLHNYHWSFISVTDGIATSHDSLNSNSFPNLPEKFLTYLYERHNVRDYRVDSSFPRQTNGYDCGVHMLLGLKWWALGYPRWDFKAEDTYYYRLLMARELLHEKLARRQL